MTITCKWCKHYHPNGMVEDGDFAACKLENPTGGELRVDPMTGLYGAGLKGKNIHRDCKDWTKAGFFDKISKFLTYSITFPFMEE